MVPHAEMIIVPGATHSLLFERTDEVTGRVLSWLTRLPKAEENGSGAFDHCQ
jgi:pimeloyl-ACP methyl ester carboxylesterase